MHEGGKAGGQVRYDMAHNLLESLEFEDISIYQSSIMIIMTLTETAEPMETNIGLCSIFYNILDF